MGPCRFAFYIVYIRIPTYKKLQICIHLNMLRPQIFFLRDNKKCALRKLKVIVLQKNQMFA